MLTDNGREFCGTEKRPYELYLDLNGIEHRRTKIRSPKTNGFVERFNGTVLDEFFRVKMRETFHGSVEALQVDLDDWLIHYNTERPIWATATWAEARSKPSCHSSTKKVTWADRRRAQHAPLVEALEGTGFEKRWESGPYWLLARP